VNRNATATWQGSPTEGTGTITTGSEALSDARYATGSADGGATCAEELLAAAVAVCFASELAKGLHLAGLCAELIESSVIVGADETAADPSISYLQLNVRVKVPALSQDQFIQAALSAKANSRVARLLKTTISMTASLEAA
jgi:osmotically inducible protein OsmC